MSLYVVDASVAVKWFLPEVLSEAALGILEDENELHAPEFLLLEVDSVLWKHIRKGGLSRRRASEIRKAIRLFPGVLHPMEAILDLAFEMAVQSGQTVYDCLYLALAHLLDGRMLTADRKLVMALEGSLFQKRTLWIGEYKAPTA